MLLSFNIRTSRHALWLTDAVMVNGTDFTVADATIISRMLAGFQGVSNGRTRARQRHAEHVGCGEYFSARGLRRGRGRVGAGRQ